MMPPVIACLVCDNPEARVTIGRYAPPDLGLPNVVLENVELFHCDRCGEEGPLIPDLQGLLTVIARHLATRPRRLTPAEFRFLRKFLGWSSKDAASFFGVQPETMSRWERGRRAISADADILLRLAIRHEAPVSDYDAHDLAFPERVRRLRLLIASNEPPASIRIESTADGGWAAHAA